MIKKTLSVFLAAVILLCTMSFVFTAEAKAPATVKNISVDIASGKNDVLIIKCKWKKQKGASGYQLYDSKKHKKVFIKGGGKNKYNFKYKLECSEDAFIKVRAYKIVKGKKVYGPWSSKKWYNRSFWGKL